MKNKKLMALFLATLLLSGCTKRVENDKSTSKPVHIVEINEEDYKEYLTESDNSYSNKIFPIKEVYVEENINGYKIITDGDMNDGCMSLKDFVTKKIETFESNPLPVPFIECIYRPNDDTVYINEGWLRALFNLLELKEYDIDISEGEKMINAKK